MPRAGPRSSYEKTGKAKREERKDVLLQMPKTRRVKTDITLPPAYIDAIKKRAAKDGIGIFETHRIAVHAYARELAERPITPRPTKCETCQREFQAPRAQGNLKRLRVTVNFDQDCVDFLDWISVHFYHGVWSQAFEAAMLHYLGKDAPKPETNARNMG